MSIDIELAKQILNLSVKPSLGLGNALGEAVASEGLKGMMEAAANTIGGLGAVAGIKCGVAAICGQAALGAMTVVGGLAAPVATALVLTAGGMAMKSHEIQTVAKLVSNADAIVGEQLVKDGGIKTAQDKAHVYAYLGQETTAYARAQSQIGFIDNLAATTQANSPALTAEKQALLETKQAAAAHIEQALWTAKCANCLPKAVAVKYNGVISETMKTALENKGKNAPVAPAYAVRPLKVSYKPTELANV